MFHAVMGAGESARSVCFGIARVGEWMGSCWPRCVRVQCMCSFHDRLVGSFCRIVCINP